MNSKDKYSALSPLMYISQGDTPEEQLAGIRKAVQYGVRTVLLRLKNFSATEQTQTAIEAKAICRESAASFLINDHIQLAIDTQADGIHLGEDDAPVWRAAKLPLIGVSVHNAADIKEAIKTGADYLILRPFKCKDEQTRWPAIGLEGIRKLYEELPILKEKIVYVSDNLSLPDCLKVMEMGVHGVALSSYISESKAARLASVVKRIETMKSDIDKLIPLYRRK